MPQISDLSESTNKVLEDILKDRNQRTNSTISVKTTIDVKELLKEENSMRYKYG